MSEPKGKEVATAEPAPAVAAKTSKTEIATPAVASPTAASPTAASPTAASPTAASPTAATPAAATPAAASPTASPAPATQLQPPQTWTEMPPDDPNADADSAIGEDAASSTASITSSILNYRTLNGRTYHNDRGDNHYWGPNDDRQNNTLDIGHHTFTLLMGGKLYTAPLPEHIDKALDIGTGTGIWAIDFADERPGTHVIGTDLSPIQPDWVPPNLSFQIDDFTEDWTFEKNAYDYVHTRWLVGCVQDWKALLAKAYSTLKPGGIIECMDFDGDMSSDDNTVTGTSAIGQWGHIFQEGARKLGSRASFNPVREGLIREAIEAAGFESVTETSYKMPASEWAADPVLQQIGQFTRYTMINDIEGFISMMATQLGWSTEEISVYAAHLRRELKGLAIHAYFQGCAIWARKPLHG